VSVGTSLGSYPEIFPEISHEYFSRPPFVLMPQLHTAIRRPITWTS
jgi:hypothetical protein